MNEELVMKAAVSAVPQWYVGDHARNTYELELDGRRAKFCSHYPLTPNLSMLYTYIRQQLKRWHSELPTIPTPRQIAQIREDIAVRWLEIIDSSVNWSRFIAHIEEARFRTYENYRVMMNLVICGSAGARELSDPAMRKILDPLSSSAQVYFRVDRELRFLDYEEILWKEVRESAEYRFIPEFLQPFASTLKEGEHSVHIREHGDVFIMNSRGLLASNRKGCWHVYDAQTFKNSVSAIIGNFAIGSSLFEIIFDLSYRRRGALLVYDPERTVIGQVINPQSVIGGPSAAPDAARGMLAPVIRGIRLDRREHAARKKHLFLEIAGIDGAVIFDTDEILAVGAMIKPHSGLPGYAGARTTAAQSAYRYGGIPFKVSSDGDISILFASAAADDSLRGDAEMCFM